MPDIRHHIMKPELNGQAELIVQVLLPNELYSKRFTILRVYAGANGEWAIASQGKRRVRDTQ